jgi:hypothetical protein
MDTVDARLAALAPDRGTLLWAAVLLNTELLVVLAYLALATPRFDDLSGWKVAAFYAYPFVWLNAAVWGVTRVRLPDAPTRRRLLAGTLAGGYLLVLAYAGGLVGASADAPVTGLRVALASLPPGWSPAVVYGGEHLQLALLPFKVGAYLALAYLVYATVLDAAGSAAGGLLGLFSCVSCTLPVIAGVLSGFVGGSAALVSAATAQSYALSTAAFVVTVVLLVWRPTVGRLRQAL